MAYGKRRTQWCEKQEQEKTKAEQEKVRENTRQAIGGYFLGCIIMAYEYYSFVCVCSDWSS